MLLLLKAYSNVKYANEFLDGKLPCETLASHRERDAEEGTAFVSRSDLSAMTINAVDITNDVVSVTSKSNAAFFVNVFCMYSWTPPFDDATKERVILDKESQIGSLRTLADGYGEHAVVIHRIPSFIRRLRAAFSAPHNRIHVARSGLVKYNLYNRIPATYKDALEMAFHKSPSFASEQEYRFAFIPNRESPGVFALDMGNIRDIATLYPTRQLYDSIEINGSKEF